MNFDNTSKSILSILQTTNIHSSSKSSSSSIKYFLPTSILILIILISIWASCFYFILGLCYYFQSGILLEDLNIHYENNSLLFKQEITKQYYQLSFNCFFSFSIYLILLFLCLIVLYYRKKTLPTKI